MTEKKYDLERLFFKDIIDDATSIIDYGVSSDFLTEKEGNELKSQIEKAYFEIFISKEGLLDQYFTNPEKRLLLVPDYYGESRLLGVLFRVLSNSLNFSPYGSDEYNTNFIRFRNEMDCFWRRRCLASCNRFQKVEAVFFKINDLREDLIPFRKIRTKQGTYTITTKSNNERKICWINNSK